MLEIRLEKISGTDAYSQGDRALKRMACGILVYGIGGVDSAAFHEETAEGGAGALRSNHDYVHVSGRDNAGALLVGDCESMGEIQAFALGQVLLDGGPCCDLSCVGYEIFDDGCLLACLFDAEERLSGNPSVLDGLVVGCAGTLADDDIESVVPEVEGLSGALDAVADDGYDFVFQYFMCFCQREFFPCDEVFLDVSEFELCHFVKLFICCLSFYCCLPSSRSARKCLTAERLCEIMSSII